MGLLYMLQNPALQKDMQALKKCIEQQHIAKKKRKMEVPKWLKTLLKTAEGKMDRNPFVPVSINN